MDQSLNYHNLLITLEAQLYVIKKFAYNNCGIKNSETIQNTNGMGIEISITYLCMSVST